VFAVALGDKIVLPHLLHSTEPHILRETLLVIVPVIQHVIDDIFIREGFPVNDRVVPCCKECCNNLGLVSAVRLENVDDTLNFCIIRREILVVIGTVFPSILRWRSCELLAIT